MENKKLTLYMHAGSGNHGCEAIVRSLTDMIHDKNKDLTPCIISNDKDEDLKYLDENYRVFKNENHISKNVFIHSLYYGYRMISGDKESFLRYRFKEMFKDLPNVAISIGGDTYCYDSMLEDIMLTNSALNKKNVKTILLGCSVEENIINKEEVKKDLNRYSKILARESLTYDALINAGIPKDKVKLIPDPAFTMVKKDMKLPSGFLRGNTVGINLSPLISSYAADKNAPIKYYEELINYLLKETGYNIALIPHVVWDRSDDTRPLSILYEKFKDSGRVVFIGDYSAPELKGFISSCRFFIGARTHATIAAYSTLVPTLVIGYSVKARGIAKDIFGTDKDYCLPIQDLNSGKQLIDAFKFLEDNEDMIKDKLSNVMPSYIERAYKNADEVLKLLN